LRGQPIHSTVPPLSWLESWKFTGKKITSRRTTIMNKRASLILALGRPAIRYRILSVFLALSMCLVLTAELSASEQFGKVEYLPAKVEGHKHGSDPIKGHVIFDKDKKTVEFQNKKGQQIVSVPYDKIKSMLYEKTSRPRYAEAIIISPLFLLSKSKKHFLTFQYTDEKGDGKFMMLHMDKSNATDIVSTAEADTGQKVTREEER
jgi:hypothetical protein